jgi:DNA mismatch repair protein MSH5
MAFRATPGRTPPGPGPRSGIPSASFPSPQPPMAGPGGIEEEDEEEPAEVSAELGGLGEAEPTPFHVD